MDKWRPIHQALQALSSRCDGAVTEDGVGFNGFDTHAGHALAALPELKQGEARYGWLLLRKYRAQLATVGIDYDALPEPPRATPPAPQPLPTPAPESSNGDRSAPRQPSAARNDRTISEGKNEKGELGFRVFFDYDPALVDAVKKLPGRRFQNLNGLKFWWVPKKWLARVLVFGEAHGFDLTSLGATATTIAEAKEATKLHTELTPEQDARWQAIWPKLLPFQIQAVHQNALAVLNHGDLDASGCGVGKTYLALAVSIVLARPVYVVCPKTVIPSWKRAAAHFEMRLYGSCNYELLRMGKQKALNRSGADEKLKFEWKLPKETIIIADECHRAKDRKTLNAKMLIQALRQGYDLIGLSATAADNPMQMSFVGLLTKLFEDESDFWGWAKHHGVSEGRYGWDFYGGPEVLAKIHHDIFPAHGSRIRIADLGDAFPETQITAEAYDMGSGTKEIEEIYAEMKAELKRLAAKEKEDGDPIPLTIRLRARQRIETLKIPATVEMIEDAVEEGMSVAVFVNFNESADALASKLGTRCTIRGGQSDEVRECNIQRFQEDKEPVIICNIKAGGVGISLHGSPTARMRLAIIMPSDSCIDLIQALGRCHRANGAKSLQRILFAANTIEEEICRNVQAKISRLSALNDGDLAPASFL